MQGQGKGKRGQKMPLLSLNSRRLSYGKLFPGEGLGLFWTEITVVLFV